jgi:hypothetical protein
LLCHLNYGRGSERVLNLLLSTRIWFVSGFGK